MPHQVMVERAALRGIAFWQGALDPPSDPIRKRAVESKGGRPN
jgi:hypothetical protein